MNRRNLLVGGSIAAAVASLFVKIGSSKGDEESARHDYRHVTPAEAEAMYKHGEEWRRRLLPGFWATFPSPEFYAWAYVAGTGELILRVYRNGTVQPFSHHLYISPNAIQNFDERRYAEELLKLKHAIMQEPLMPEPTHNIQA